ncbi:MAG: hypothetical protein AAGC55_05690, partial [Myxococcota bacterium]
PGPWRVRAQRQQAPPPQAPSWARDTARRHEERGPAPPVSDLLRVIRYLEVLTGRDSASGDVRTRCRELLGDPERAAALLRLLSDDE